MGVFVLGVRHFVLLSERFNLCPFHNKLIQYTVMNLLCFVGLKNIQRIDFVSARVLEISRDIFWPSQFPHNKLPPGVHGKKEDSVKEIAIFCQQWPGKRMETSS